MVSFHVYHLNGRRVSFFPVCRINVGGEVGGWLVGDCLGSLGLVWQHDSCSQLTFKIFQNPW